MGLQSVYACRQSVSPTHRPRSALGQCDNLHQGQFLESAFEAGRKKLWIGKQIIMNKMSVLATSQHGNSTAITTLPGLTSVLPLLILSARAANSITRHGRPVLLNPNYPMK